MPHNPHDQRSNQTVKKGKDNLHGWDFQNSQGAFCPGNNKIYFIHFLSRFIPIIFSDIDIYYLVLPIIFPTLQLFSINAFVRSGQTATQVPLAFVVMSRKKTRDYEAVLEAIRDRICGGEWSAVKAVADFEKGKKLYL